MYCLSKSMLRWGLLADEVWPQRRIVVPRKLVALLAVAFISNPSLLAARTLRVHAGTPVYGELDERVTSRTKKDRTSVGDLVQAHVWRDVIVDGRAAIPAGAPMMLRVAEVKKSKLAGIRGKIRLEALSITMPDGSDIPLSGGYDKSGHGRKALSITLAAVVAWPLIFIKGKHAILEPGTVFDARIRTTMSITSEQSERRPIRLSGGPSFEVVVLYDAMDAQGKSKKLPVRLEACDGASPAGARVVSVNDGSIEPLPLQVGSLRDEDGCTLADATINLKQLGKHFTRGINRFEMEADGQRDEVILDIEL